MFGNYLIRYLSESEIFSPHHISWVVGKCDLFVATVLNPAMSNIFEPLYKKLIINLIALIAKAFLEWVIFSKVAFFSITFNPEKY